MDKHFYNNAVRIMGDIRRLEPSLVSARDSELCVLLTENGTTYAGVTSLKVVSGQLMTSCPEFNAIMAMVPEGESRVRQLITISFARKTVSIPCEDCLKLMLRIDPHNADSLIFDAANHAVTVRDMLGDAFPKEFEVRIEDVEEETAPADDVIEADVVSANAAAAEAAREQPPFA